MNLRIAAVSGLVAMGSAGCAARQHFNGSMTAQCPSGDQSSIQFTWNGNDALPSHQEGAQLGGGEACGCPYQLLFTPNGQPGYDAQLYSLAPACGDSLKVAEPNAQPVELKKGVVFSCFQSTTRRHTDMDDGTGKVVYTDFIDMTCPGLGTFSTKQRNAK